jgi:hypothetical protein
MIGGPCNNALQLTSGGFVRASRASFMRRLQLISVFGRRTDGGRVPQREGG